MESTDATQFKMAMKKAALKVLEPELSWTRQVDEPRAHNMFALMLDPRFKRLKVIVDFVGDKRTAEEVCGQYTTLLVGQLERVYSILHPQEVMNSTESEEHGEEEGLYAEEPHNKNTVVEDELMNFRKCHSAKMEEDPDIWWHDNAAKFPIVAYLAKRYLAIPGSQAEVERVFSIAGVFTRLHRVNMGSETLDTLIRINKNVSNDPDEAMGKKL